MCQVGSIPPLVSVGYPRERGSSLHAQKKLKRLGRTTSVGRKLWVLGKVRESSTLGKGGTAELVVGYFLLRDCSTVRWQGSIACCHDVEGKGKGRWHTSGCRLQLAYAMPIPPPTAYPHQPTPTVDSKTNHLKFSQVESSIWPPPRLVIVVLGSVNMSSGRGGCNDPWRGVT